jgi:hypothetical protein
MIVSTLASVQAPIDHAPQAHVHFGTHVEWVEFLDQLPKVDTV